MRDILRHCGFILEDSAGLSFDNYLEKRVVRQSIERSLTVIGIAAIRLRELDEDLYSEIAELRSAVGLRNRLSHGYDDNLNDEVVWEAATSSIPKLLQRIEELL